MIGLGKSIAYTAHSMGYGWNQEKGAEVVYTEHLVPENPWEIIQEFKIIQQQNHLCHNNLLLCPEPYHQGQMGTDEQTS